MSCRRLKCGAFRARALPWSFPILISLAGWWGFIREPLRAWTSRHAQQLQGEELTLAKVQGMRDAQKRRNIEAFSRVGTLVPILPSPMLAVEKIAEAARSHGLSSLTYEVSEPISRGRTLALPLSIALRGSFGDASTFLRNLEASPLRPIIRQIELERATSQNAVTLRVEALVISAEHLAHGPRAATTSGNTEEN